MIIYVYIMIINNDIYTEIIMSSSNIYFIRYTNTI